jgi:DNA-binding NtrC family response regulator
MWYIELEDRGRLTASLRLPAAGLTLGGGDGAQIVLPGLTETVKFEPTRTMIFVTRSHGENGELHEDEAISAGRFTLRAARRARAAVLDLPAGQGTKTLAYDQAAGSLTTTHTRLRLIEGPDAPREIDLDDTALVIGKHAGCGLVLSDEYVSGRHALLAPGRDGWTIIDQDSRNGVFIEEIAVGEALVLPGVPVRLGSTVFVLEQVDEQETVEPAAAEQFAGMVGKSEAIRRVFSLIQRMAEVDATVLIQGASGTGKELVARAIHFRGGRAAGPFVAINCGSVVRELVASELFGHTKGAFTGATGDRPGLFEIAAGGTVFLDEIAELPLDLQPHLLRVLEQREVQRVGGSRITPVDVRVVAASNRDLRVEVEAGRFREDLYYRLDTLPIALPPLADRREDLPLLVEHLLTRECRRQGRATPPTLDADTWAALEAYHWPGNIRELGNVLTRALLLSNGTAITPEELIMRPVHTGGDEMPTLAAAEATLIARALARYPSRREAAAKLGIASSTLYEKIKKYELE